MMERLTVGTQETQALTGLGRDHIRKLVREGVLPNVGNSKRLLIPKSAVIRYLEQAGQK
jgi:excisionase family DNA binding protein